MDVVTESCSRIASKRGRLSSNLIFIECAELPERANLLPEGVATNAMAALNVFGFEAREIGKDSFGGISANQAGE
jgi:hypothetical protein